MDRLDFLNIKSLKPTTIFGDEAWFELELADGSKKEVISDRESLLLMAEKFYEAAQHISNKRRNTTNENQNINAKEFQGYTEFESLF